MRRNVRELLTDLVGTSADPKVPHECELAIVLNDQTERLRYFDLNFMSLEQMRATLDTIPNVDALWVEYNPVHSKGHRYRHLPVTTAIQIQAETESAFNAFVTWMCGLVSIESNGIIPNLSKGLEALALTGRFSSQRRLTLALQVFIERIPLAAQAALNDAIAITDDIVIDNGVYNRPFDRVPTGSCRIFIPLKTTTDTQLWLYVSSDGGGFVTNGFVQRLEVGCQPIWINQAAFCTLGLATVISILTKGTRK